MAPGVDVRPIAPAELDPFLACIGAAMGSTPSPERRRQHEATLEYDRTLAAFDGTELVATAQALSFEMSVPGGADLATAGVKGIATLPTHRRRGLLRTLMRRQMDDLQARGDVLACLWATEGSIYPRFGYGMAEVGMSVSVERPAPVFAADAPPPADVRIVPRADHATTAVACYEQLRPRRPGMHRRTAAAWRRWTDMAPDAALVVTPDGYARYTVTPNWGRRGPANEVSVHELVAITPAAEAAIWRYLFDLDLAASWSAFHRPLDDAIQWLVEDPRTLSRDIHGGLYLRLVDVGAALRSRRYRTPLDVVIEVTDDFCPWNEGRWRLAADGEGASCDRTTDPADVSVPAAQLASLYLGGTGFADLHRAGRVDVGRDDFVEAVDVAFRWTPLPWAVTWF